MKRRIRFLVSCLLTAAALAVPGCKQQLPRAAAGQGMPAVPVTVARASQESVPLELRVVGSAEASATVQVKSQVAGQLLKANFSEGQSVSMGARLFEIDARPYQEALRQAEALLARDQAQLRQAEANLARDQAQTRNAEADAVRYAELLREGIISKAQNDQVRTSADVARESARASQAAIESARAAIQNDMAAIEKAKLDIAYCAIDAPLSGRTGNLLVHPGNLVGVNGTPLVVIHQVSPIFVTFSVPEQHLPAIRRLNSVRPLAVKVFSQDDPGRVASGRLVVIDNQVDTTTGTIRLKGEFDNRDGLLWPGQFVNVALTLHTIANATVVPAEAVQAGQQGQFVYVVKSDSTVEARIVTLGRGTEGKVIIEKGVAPGETVVTDGQLRLAPGARIRVVPANGQGVKS